MSNLPTHSTYSLFCCPYRKTIRVKIVDEEEYERQENFFIALGEPKWMERGISGVRFFKNQTKRKASNLNKLEGKKKATTSRSSPFSSLLLSPSDQHFGSFPSYILALTLFRYHLCLLNFSLFPNSSFPAFQAALQPQFLIALMSHFHVLL